MYEVCCSTTVLVRCVFSLRAGAGAQTTTSLSVSVFVPCTHARTCLVFVFRFIFHITIVNGIFHITIVNFTGTRVLEYQRNFLFAFFLDQQNRSELISNLASNLSPRRHLSIK